MRRALLGALLLLAGPAPVFAQAGDLAAGRAKAQMCITCHGALGLARQVRRCTRRRSCAPTAAACAGTR
jgi:cytochrome c553